MYLEEGRALIHGILLLLFVAITYWINLTGGLIAISIMGIMLVQQGLTDWCFLDPILKWFNFIKKENLDINND